MKKLVLALMVVSHLHFSIVGCTPSKLGYTDYKPRGAEITVSELSHIIRLYYDREGEWAGVFRMNKILRLETTEKEDDTFLAHVEYEYAAIPGNKKQRTDTGYDQRAFWIREQAGLYTVVRMGGYQSACFGCSGHKVNVYNPYHSVHRSDGGVAAAATAVGILFLGGILLKSLTSAPVGGEGHSSSPEFDYQDYERQQERERDREQSREDNRRLCRSIYRSCTANCQGMSKTAPSALGSSPYVRCISRCDKC